MTHFGAGLVGCEHPFDARAGGISLSFPSSDFADEALRVVDSAIQALAAEDADLDLEARHVRVGSKLVILKPSKCFRVCSQKQTSPRTASRSSLARRSRYPPKHSGSRLIAPCSLVQSRRRPKQLGLHPLHCGDAGGHRTVDVSGRRVRLAEPEAAEVDQRRALVVIAGRAGGLEAGHPVCAPWRIVPGYRFLACGCALELGDGLANSPA